MVEWVVQYYIEHVKWADVLETPLAESIDAQLQIWSHFTILNQDDSSTHKDQFTKEAWKTIFILNLEANIFFDCRV